MGMDPERNLQVNPGGVATCCQRPGPSSVCNTPHCLTQYESQKPQQSREKHRRLEEPEKGWVWLKPSLPNRDRSPGVSKTPSAQTRFRPVQKPWPKKGQTRARKKMQGITKVRPMLFKFSSNSPPLHPTPLLPLAPA